MAVAAVSDATQKDNRRKQLNRRLEDAKADLARVMRMAPELEQPPRYPSTASTSPTQSSTLVEALNLICVSNAELKKQGKNFFDPRFNVYGMLPKRFGRTRFRNLDFLRDAVAAEELQIQARRREPVSALHVSRYKDMINGLVDNLMSEAYRRDFPDDPEVRRRWVQSLDGAWTALKLLRSEGYPNYGSATTDLEWSAKQRRELNNSLRALFQSWETYRADKSNIASSLASRAHSWVAKISNNLLVAPIAPAVETYNVLIVGFTRMGEHDLANVVVESFLHYSQMVPTQQTLVCLLHHYRITGNMLGFYAIIRRLIGVDHRGVKLRRAPVPAVAEDPFLYKWAQTSDIAVTDGMVIERAKIDHDVLDALLRGLLHFGHVTQAAIVFASHIRYCVDMSVLFHLVERVVQTLDIKGAHVLLRSFVRHVDLLQSLLLRSGPDPRGLVDNIRQLMNIAPGLFSRQSLPGAPGDPMLSNVDAARIHRFVMTLDIASISNHLDRLGRALKRIHMRLNHIPNADLDFALEPINRFVATRAQAHVLEDNVRRMARLVGINSLVQREAERCSYHQKEFCHILSERMPYLYQSFMRNNALPFAMRIQSWKVMASTDSPYERLEQQVVDSAAIASFFEKQLRRILLSGLLTQAQAQRASDLQDSKGILVHYRRMSLQELIKATTEELNKDRGENSEPTRQEWRSIPDRLRDVLNRGSFGLLAPGVG